MANNVGYTLSYKADMTCLFGVLLDRNRDVVESHMLLELMYNCISYRRLYEVVKDPDKKKIVLDSINSADAELNELMNAWCLFITERNLILSLVRRSV